MFLTLVNTILVGGGRWGLDRIPIDKVVLSEESVKDKVQKETTNPKETVIFFPPVK